MELMSQVKDLKDYLKLIKMDGTNRENIKEGQTVGITLRQDYRSGKITTGVVKKVLTNASHHPHGILVELEDGSVGRVKEINGKGIVSQPNVNKTPYEVPEEKTDSIEDIIGGGENEFVEFKSSVLWSNNLSNEEIQKSNSKYIKKFGNKASKLIIAKSIASFLNTIGGNLVIGVKENKDSNADEIIGVSGEFGKLKNKDPCVDGYRRMLMDEVIKVFLPKHVCNHLINFIKITFPIIEEKEVCLISIKKCDEPVFVKFAAKEMFYIRTDAESQEIIGSDITNYCRKHWK
jgi:uncharacterized repeat protein (TIGR03833 family)